MLIHSTWLQSFFAAKLPSAQEIANGLTFHSFEIDGVFEKEGGEWVIDVDVLPNRAPDCLSHRGIAQEVSALFDLPFKKEKTSELPIDEALQAVDVRVESDLCTRYVGVRIEGVTIEDTIPWIANGLKDLEQRSINSIVDATNFCLLMYGQPLHAFDADKVVGDIVVRTAQAGETFTTLDGKELVLDPEMLVIADQEGVLALAGIKGGKKAEVTNTTKNIILEAAHFNGVSIRKTSQRVGIRTDASKRFENGIARSLADVGMQACVEQILAHNPEARVSSVSDVRSVEDERVALDISVEFIAQKLGTTMSGEEIVALLSKIGFECRQEGDVVHVIVPEERLDIITPVDCVEEVGRLYGYDKIVSIPLPHKEPARHAESFIKTQTARGKLLPLGFSEIYNRTFREEGEVRIANPLAQDKPYLRTNLTLGMQEKLEMNSKNVLFEDYPVLLFEIGTVFPHNDKEEKRLVIGVGYTKPKYLNASTVMEEAIRTCGLQESDGTTSKTDTSIVFETPLVNVTEEESFDLKDFINNRVSHQKVSAFPAIMRDVALFVPEGTSPAEVVAVIDELKTDLCVEGPVLFDEFHKDGRVSLAFRLVFQSTRRTLSDDEVNAIMEVLYSHVEKAGWTVR